MSYTPKNILVTGIAGFMGSNLLAKLLEEGHKVTGIDNLSMGSLDNISEYVDHERFTFIKADVVDAETFDLDEQFDVAIHLAAFKIPRYGKTIETLKINFMGSENILEFSRKQKCKCVLASTSDVYGRNPDLPFNEETSNCVIGSSKSPRWAYAVSKLFDEHLALAYSEAYDFPVVLMRFFGSYGPYQHLSWWGGPPPVFIEAVLKDEVIPIHGDGLQTRSFTYVSDTIAGIYECAMRDAANGEILNIGSTEEVTILELAHTIKRMSGTPGDLKHKLIPYDEIQKGKKYEDVMRRVPDTTLCEKILGVKAQVSLEEGMEKTIAWQRKVQGL